MNGRKLLSFVFLMLLGATLVFANEAQDGQHDDANQEKDLGVVESNVQDDSMVEECVAEVDEFLSHWNMPQQVEVFLNGFSVDWEKIFRADGFELGLFENNGFVPVECNQIYIKRKELFEMYPCTTELDYTQDEVFDQASKSKKFIELTKANIVCVVGPHSEDDNINGEGEDHENSDANEDNSNEQEEKEDDDDDEDSDEEAIQAVGEQDDYDNETSSDDEPVASDGDESSSDDNEEKNNAAHQSN